MLITGLRMRSRTAAVAEPDGRCLTDFEVGDRSGNTFQRLYARLPDSELHRSDAYAVYQSRLPPADHVVGKGGVVNWNAGCVRGCGAS